MRGQGKQGKQDKGACSLEAAAFGIVESPKGELEFAAVADATSNPRRGLPHVAVEKQTLLIFGKKINNF